MPLLKNKTFQRYVITNLKPDEKIFFCKVTNEAFRHYEAFYDRILLCNSSCWSCEMTGKQNLTYNQALESEESAKKALNSFPNALQQPLLFVASLVKKTSLNELSDDVFKFVKNRYFVGEIVEVQIEGVRRKNQIKEIIPPNESSKSGKGEDREFGPDPDKYRYQVADVETNIKNIVSAPSVSREKGALTKPINKLFLKQNMEMKNGTWKVKENSMERLKLKPGQNVLNGPLPTFNKKSKKSSSPAVAEKTTKVKSKKHSDKEAKGPASGGHGNTTSSTPKVESAVSEKSEKKVQEPINFFKNGEINSFKLTPEEKALIKEKQKQRIEEKRMKEKEEKAKERAKKKEEKKILNKYMQEWRKPREDLDLDDHKPLPPPTPIDCSIPQSSFGEFLQVLDFLHNYGDAIDLKDIFPQGLTFELLERALVEKDIQGPFNDLLTALLSTLLQARNKGLYDTEPDVREDRRTAKYRGLIQQALETLRHSKQCQGTTLPQLPRDSFTLSELLRLHIQCSGIPFGGDPDTDPALWFKTREAHILDRLASVSIFELPLEDKLKVLLLLLDQTLLLDNVKDAIEENVVKLKQHENELRQLQCSYSKSEKKNTNRQKKNGEKGQGDGNGKSQEQESESLPQETPEEREKNLKDKTRKREEFVKKERELKAQIYKLRASACLTPIGRDRAHRMFFVFNSLPGLFVAHEDTQIGDCQPKSAPSKLYEDMPLIILKKYIHKGTGELISGKENEAVPLSALKQANRTISSKQQTVLNPKLNSNVASPQMGGVKLLEGADEERKSALLNGAMLCTGCPTTCTVHNPSLPGRVQWAFYSTETEISNLVNNLNPRGCRENHLRKQLEQGFLAEFIKDCPIHRLNKAYPPPPLPELRKSQRYQLRYESEFANMEPREALETTFCDLILELEEKISVASLGHLQVPDRAGWRSFLEQHYKYSDTQEERKTQQQPLTAAVAFLAKCLQQVAQSVEPRFLRPPLGETEDFKKKKAKYQAELTKHKASQKNKEETDKNNPCIVRVRSNNQDTSESASVEDSSVEITPPPRSTLDLWSESLANSSSLAQLFVHLYTLETSVAWDRSLLKVSCKVCRRKGDSDSMLLCDGCDRGYHTHCLKPPLKEVPDGIWYCQTCRPKEEVPASPRKRAILDEEDELESDFQSDDQSTEDEEGEDEEEEEDENDDVCDKCRKGGHLICCDNCPLSFHLECTELRRVPRGIWHCPKCTHKSQKRRATLPLEKPPAAKKAKVEESSGKRRSAAVTDVDFNYVSCEEMIETLFKHQDSWPFRRSVTKRDAPDYFEIIKQPMDLGTVRHKLRSMLYRSNEEFLQDIWLTLDNCEAYNPQKSDEYKAGSRLRRKVKELEATILGRAPTPPETPDNKRKRKSN